MTSYLDSHSYINVSLAGADYDVLMYDAVFWPAAILQDQLNIASVALWPVPLLLSANEHTIPTPVAYHPLLGTAFSPTMVSMSVIYWRRSATLYCWF